MGVVRRRTTRETAGWVVALAAIASTPSAAHDVPAAPVNEGWIGEVSASVTAQTGTTDTFSGAIDTTSERTFERDWIRGRFNGVYGTSRTRNQDKNDQVLQDAQGLFGDWKHTIHERFFWASGLEVSRNSIQDRMARAALATGPGYRFWEGEKPDVEHFDGRVGVGYRYELYNPDNKTVADTGTITIGDGNLDNDHFADLMAGFEYRNMLFQDKVEYTHTGLARMPLNDPGAYMLTSEVIFGVPLTEAWSFRTAFFVEYIAVQPSDVNNVTTRTTIGLGYKF